MGSTAAGRTHQILREWNDDGFNPQDGDGFNDFIRGPSFQLRSSLKRGSIKSRSPNYAYHPAAFPASLSAPDAVTVPDRGVKWEELPLAHLQDQEQGADQEGLDGKDKSEEPKTIKEHLLKILKIMLPHVGLTAILLSYIAGGAAVFQLMESREEVAQRAKKLQTVKSLYSNISNVCGMNLGFSLNDTLGQLLRNLSLAHEWDGRFSAEEQLWDYDRERTNIQSHWTFPAAVLYALTVITTTGYEHITPRTDVGRLFTVFFGLFGIPLMFITAADIGKFLSECVIAIYSRWHQLKKYIRSKLCKKKLDAGAAPTANGDLRRESAEALDPAELLDPDLDRVQLPIFAYFCLILGYCAIGGLVFVTFETGATWTFVHGFFFSFNTITTIGLGNVVVYNFFYTLFIVCYVIVGLAVITMCVDLASSQLKAFFTRLHYFGRRFRGSRAFLNMSDDIKEAMKVIAALKKSRAGHPGGITLDDLKQFLEMEQDYLNRPYVPTNINMLKWVDEEDNSSARSVSLKIANSDPMLHI